MGKMGQKFAKRSRAVSRRAHANIARSEKPVQIVSDLIYDAGDGQEKRNEFSNRNMFTIHTETIPRDQTNRTYK